MITISWNKFDKAFWLTAKNMRNLISISIQIGDNLNQLETRQDQTEKDVEQAKKDIQQAQTDITNNIQNTNTAALTANEALRTAQGVRSDFDTFSYAVNADLDSFATKIRTLQEDVFAHINKYPL